MMMSDIVLLKEPLSIEGEYTVQPLQQRLQLQLHHANVKSVRPPIRIKSYVALIVSHVVGLWAMPPENDGQKRQVIRGAYIH